MRVKGREVSSESVSILTAIRAKEREIAERLERAGVEAAARLETARQEAETLVAQARLRGRRAADARYEAGVMRARAEADEIRSTARVETEAFLEQASQPLVVAAERIVAFVLPKVVDTGARNPDRDHAVGSR